jgi:hypothetical protein
MLLSPLAGVVAAGWLAEIGFLFGSARGGVLIGALTALMILSGRRGAVVDWAKSLPMIGAAFLPAAVAALVVPYPGVGLWYGDYLEYHHMGEALRTGHWPPAFLHRPPLFGGATLLIRPFAKDLQALECVSAVSTAGALAALHWATRCSIQSLWTVAAVPFFFLHTATCWPKLLAAGCVLAAFVRFESRDSYGRWEAAFWFATGIAAHTAAIIMAPIFVVRILRGRSRFLSPAADFGRVVVAVGAIAIPFEAWAAIQFGPDARVAANPALFYDRASGFAATFGDNLLTTFVGRFDETLWTPVEKHLFPWFDERFMQAAVFVSWQAGTLLGMLLPFAPLLWRRRRRIAQLFGRYRWEFAAALVIVVANAALNPTPNPAGVAQTGLTPLCLLMFVAIVRWLDRDRLGGIVARPLAVLFGLLPSVVVNVVAFSALRLPDASARIGDAHQRAAIGSMYASNLNTIACEVGWFAVAVGIALAAVQVVVVLRSRSPTA